MAQNGVEVVAIDAFSGNEFVLYFSDETYTAVSSTELAECFPKRKEIEELDEGEGDYGASG